jgi:hypothetical protein
LREQSYKKAKNTYLLPLNLIILEFYFFYFDLIIVIILFYLNHFWYILKFEFSFNHSKQILIIFLFNSINRLYFIFTKHYFRLSFLSSFSFNYLISIFFSIMVINLFLLSTQIQFIRLYYFTSNYSINLSIIIFLFRKNQFHPTIYLDYFYYFFNLLIFYLILYCLFCFINWKNPLLFSMFIKILYI